MKIPKIVDSFDMNIGCRIFAFFLLISGYIVQFSSASFAGTAVVEVPHLDWINVPGAHSYEYEISKDINFTQVVMRKVTSENFIKGSIQENFVNWVNLEPGTYYWHVRGIGDQGKPGPYSAPAEVALSHNLYKVETLYSQIPEEQLETTTQTQFVPIKETTSPRRNDFALYGFGFGTLGSAGNSKGDIASRSMMAWTPALSFGYRLGKFTPSLYGEYNFSYQTTDTSKVSNQNLASQGYLAGILLKYDFRKFSITGNFLFLGQEQMTQGTTLSQASVYGNPIGFSLVFGYPISNKFYFLLVGKYVSFSIWNLGDVSNNNLSQLSYGIGLSYEIF